jgi:hypothetical protein
MSDHTTITARPSNVTLTNVVPLTAGEIAVATARWERRGLLQRLVRAN